MYARIQLANATKTSSTSEVKALSDAIDKERQTRTNCMQICQFSDPLVMLDSEKFVDRASPIADKFFIMTRDDGSVAATSLKPNKEEQSQIERFLQSPDYLPLGEAEKRLFWRYRHSLSSKKEAFVKFIMSVNWQVKNETEAALTLMKTWAEIDIE